MGNSFGPLGLVAADTGVDVHTSAFLQDNQFNAQTVIVVSVLSALVALMFTILVLVSFRYIRRNTPSQQDDDYPGTHQELDYSKDLHSEDERERTKSDSDYLSSDSISTIS